MFELLGLGHLRLLASAPGLALKQWWKKWVRQDSGLERGGVLIAVGAAYPKQNALPTNQHAEIKPLSKRKLSFYRVCAPNHVSREGSGAIS